MKEFALEANAGENNFRYLVTMTKNEVCMHGEIQSRLNI
jgi:hypothetical protein